MANVPPGQNVWVTQQNIDYLQLQSKNPGEGIIGGIDSNGIGYGSLLDKASVTSLNALTGAVTITAGTNVTVVTSGSNITISSTGGSVLTSPITSPNPILFNVDLAFGGPNPWYDIRQYGAYASNASAFSVPGIPTPNTTGTITGGTATITVASNGDWINGHGIVVTGAGPATALGTPIAPTVVPQTVIGSTTYAYQVACVDSNNAITAAGPAGTTTTGPSALGSTVFTATTTVSSAGVVTQTFASATGILPGALVTVASPLNPASVNGTFYVTAVTGGGLTISYNNPAGPAFTSTSNAAVVTVFAKNQVSLWYSSLPNNGIFPMTCLVYRSISGGLYSLVGITSSADPY